MIVLFVLIPFAVIGLIAWIAVGVRKRVDEAFTNASLASLYANLITIVSLMLMLLGIAVGVKAIVGFFNLGYSYTTPTVFGLPTGSSGNPSSSCALTGVGCSSASADFTTDRTNDIALAITLVATGLILLLVHRLLARAVRRRPGGLPSWVHGGTLLGMLALTAAGAIFGIVTTAYGIVTYVITPSASLHAPGPFGEVVGVVAAFLPAWIVCVIVLLRRQRQTEPLPPRV
ncbi:MAG: hypothetical protein ABR498_07860 [Candidatus Dormibacteria bacterium]